MKTGAGHARQSQYTRRFFVTKTTQDLTEKQNSQDTVGDVTQKLFWRGSAPFGVKLGGL